MSSSSHPAAPKTAANDVHRSNRDSAPLRRRPHVRAARQPGPPARRHRARLAWPGPRRSRLRRRHAEPRLGARRADPRARVELPARGGQPRQARLVAMVEHDPRGPALLAGAAVLRAERRHAPVPALLRAQRRALGVDRRPAEGVALSPPLGRASRARQPVLDAGAGRPRWARGSLRLGRLRRLHVRPPALREPCLAVASGRRSALAREGHRELGRGAAAQRPRAEVGPGHVPRRSVAHRARRQPVADERRSAAAVVDGHRRVHRRRRGGAELSAPAPAGIRLAGDHPGARERAAACRRGPAPAGRRARRLPERVHPRTVIPRPREDRRGAQPGPRRPRRCREVLLGRDEERLPARLRRRHRLPGGLRRPARRGHRAARAPRGRRLPRLRPARRGRRLLHVAEASALHARPRDGQRRPRAGDRRRGLPRVRDQGLAGGIRGGEHGRHLARAARPAPARPVRLPAPCGGLAVRAARLPRGLGLRARTPPRGRSRRRAGPGDAGGPAARPLGAGRACRASFHASRPSEARPRARAD